jgi:hypothetical protein
MIDGDFCSQIIGRQRLEQGGQLLLPPLREERAVQRDREDRGVLISLPRPARIAALPASRHRTAGPGAQEKFADFSVIADEFRKLLLAFFARPL